MAKQKLWQTVRCQKACYDGHIGMDNCNICGCTGSELLYIPTKERFPNTKEGWNELKTKYPKVEDSQDE